MPIPLHHITGFACFDHTTSPTTAADVPLDCWLALVVVAFAPARAPVAVAKGSELVEDALHGGREEGCKPHADSSPPLDEQDAVHDHIYHLQETGTSHCMRQ